MANRGPGAVFLGICLSALAVPARANAGALPLDQDSINNLISQSIADAFVKTVGFAALHRPYEPATPLGSKVGLDFGIELTLMRIPDDFNTALAEAGSSGSALPFLPVPKVHIHKGLGESAGVGFSYVNYQGMKIYGAEFSLAFAYPEEGTTIAARLGWSDSTVQIVSTTGWTPELLISRKLDFADPYLGLGYALISGKVTYTQSVPVIGSVTSEKTGSAKGLYSFVGVQFNVRQIGLQITLEGAYSGVDTHTLGVKVGLGF